MSTTTYTLVWLDNDDAPHGWYAEFRRHGETVDDSEKFGGCDLDGIGWDADGAAGAACDAWVEMMDDEAN